MKYFHRNNEPLDDVMAFAAQFFGERLNPAEEGTRVRRFTSPLGQLSVTVRPEGGHYTLTTVATDQPGESELDKLAKRFLTLLHTRAHPGHDPIGAY